MNWVDIALAAAGYTVGAGALTSAVVYSACCIAGDRTAEEEQRLADQGLRVDQATGQLVPLVRDQQPTTDQD